MQFCRLYRFLIPFHVGLVSYGSTTIYSSKKLGIHLFLYSFSQLVLPINEGFLSTQSPFLHSFHNCPRSISYPDNLLHVYNWSSGLHSFSPSNLSSLHIQTQIFLMQDFLLLLHLKPFQWALFMVIVMEKSVSLHIYVETLTSTVSEFGNRAFKKVIKIK